MGRKKAVASFEGSKGGGGPRDARGRWEWESGRGGNIRSSTESVQDYEASPSWGDPSSDFKTLALFPRLQYFCLGRYRQRGILQQTRYGRKVLTAVAIGN